MTRINQTDTYWEAGGAVPRGALSPQSRARAAADADASGGWTPDLLLQDSVSPPFFLTTDSSSLKSGVRSHKAVGRDVTRQMGGRTPPPAAPSAAPARVPDQGPPPRPHRACLWSEMDAGRVTCWPSQHLNPSAKGLPCFLTSGRTSATFTTKTSSTFKSEQGLRDTPHRSVNNSANHVKPAELTEGGLRPARCHTERPEPGCPRGCLHLNL